MKIPRTNESQSPKARRYSALRVLLLLLVTLIATACAQTVPRLERPVEPSLPVGSYAQAEQTLQRLLATEKPQRDLFDLGRRYKGITQSVDRVVNAETPDYARGSVQTFWVADDENKNYYQIRAVLRGKSEHLYMYVEEDLDLPQSGIDRTIREFEEVIYPTIRRYYGEELSPGVDNDPRITVLNARIPGVGGYYYLSGRISERSQSLQQ